MPVTNSTGSPRACATSCLLAPLLPYLVAGSCLVLGCKPNGDGEGDPSGIAALQGRIVVDVLPQCGVLSVFAGPVTVAAPGKRITLAGSGTEGTLFNWSVEPAALGVFEDAEAESTYFSCTQAGTGVVSLTATNSEQECQSHGDVSVECKEWGCGDGVLHEAEECDPPGRWDSGQWCDDTCHIQHIPTCEECIQGACAEQHAACVSHGTPCVDMLECYLQEPHCAGRGGGVVDCLCGESVGLFCFGLPRGVCRKEILSSVPHGATMPALEALAELRSGTGPYAASRQVAECARQECTQSCSQEF